MSALHPGDRVELRCDGAERLGAVVDVIPHYYTAGGPSRLYLVSVPGRVLPVPRRRDELHLATEPRPAPPPAPPPACCPTCKRPTEDG